VVFELYSTYGFPLELIKEIALEKGVVLDEEGFKKSMEEHQELSRTASAGMFKGGLADAGEETKKLHTAAHLMLAALRKVLPARHDSPGDSGGGDQIIQKGSNITSERLRFDFSYPRKLTEEEIKKVEDLVNEKIKEQLPVVCEEMSVDDAKQKGATGAFDSKYGERVKVYSTGEFSKEICGGPHVNNTNELGVFKITKEEASSAGVRRIKAILT
jgi:alanyl-tRNA synthetase